MRPRLRLTPCSSPSPLLLIALSSSSSFFCFLQREAQKAMQYGDEDRDQLKERGEMMIGQPIQTAETQEPAYIEVGLGPNGTSACGSCFQQQEREETHPREEKTQGPCEDPRAAMQSDETV